MRLTLPVDGRPLAPQPQHTPPRGLGIALAFVDLLPRALDLRLARGDLHRALAQRTLELVELGKVVDPLVRPLLRELTGKSKDVVAIRRLVLGFPVSVFPAVGHL